MTHVQALAYRNSPDTHDPNPTCDTQIEARHKGFWDDVPWVVFYCPTCDIYLACVGGGRHNWNYILSDESRTRLFGTQKERKNDDEV